jgi:hypothetical protein
MIFFANCRLNDAVGIIWPMIKSELYHGGNTVINARRRTGILPTIVLCAAASVVFADNPTTRPAAFHPAVIRTPEYPKTTKIPDNVLDPHGRQVIVLPSEPVEQGEDTTERSSGAIAKLPGDVHILPEGYIVANRKVRIEHRDRWFLLHPDPVPGLPETGPLRVLPNGRMAMLEAILAQADPHRQFIVTGRVTEYQGVNYILIENLLEQSEETPQKSEPAAAPTTAATETSPAHEPTAEEVVKRLMETKPRRAVVLPEQAVAAGSASAPATQGNAEGDNARWSEDTVLVDRVGRIVPGDQSWLLAFDDLGTGQKPKPILLLPCRLLETAVSLTGGGTKPITLVISGEITAHKGNNYLLLRKVLVRRDLGNFR